MNDLHVRRFVRGLATVRLAGDPFARRCLGPLALLTVAATMYPLVPLTGLTLMLYYNSIAISAMVFAFWGVLHHKPLRRRGWLLVLSGFCLWVVGDLVYNIELEVWQGAVYPAPSDAIYIAGYAVLAAGALVMVRTRRAGRDMTALLDALIIATGTAVVAAVFVIAPLASDSGLSSFAKVISSAYPVGDILLIAVIVRMWAGPGAQTKSYRLLVASLGLTTTADVAWNANLIATGSLTIPWSDVLWLGAYIAAAAAACVPSMTTLAEPSPDRQDTNSGYQRLVVLACGLVLPAAALLVDGATGGTVLWPVVGLGSLIISVLVLVRMAGVLRTVEVQAVQLAALARSDSLTGAPNRRTWDHELSRACAHSLEHETSLCVAMMDMDHFKAYNDRHGHQAGDRLLREAVAAWTEELGSSAMLARYGGEEFAVLLPDLTLTEARERIQSLRALTPSGQTFSAGVSVWDPRTEPANGVARADKALYEAKRTGRDRVLAYGDTSTGTSHTDLPEFTIVMQPIFNLITGRVCGHEALARFAGPLQDARAVFRQAHADGHGTLLEAATINAALAVPGRPKDQPLYVNASAVALTSDRFWAELPTRLDGTVVELTEDLDHVDAATLTEAVLRLRARGATVALDDLGAGVGEFYRLAALRPDIVKADRSLVQGCATAPGQSAVLQALVTYAGQLGATLCAEGVEDVADLEHVINLGVSLAQGHLLGRPGEPWQAEPAGTALACWVDVGRHSHHS